MWDDCVQLLGGGCARRSVRRLVDATRQTDTGIGVGEHVDTVDEDAGRPVKPQSLRRFDRLHEVVCHRDVRPFGCDRGETLFSDLPVGTAVEIEKCDVHGATVKLDQYYKVKG